MRDHGFHHNDVRTHPYMYPNAWHCVFACSSRACTPVYVRMYIVPVCLFIHVRTYMHMNVCSRVRGNIPLIYSCSTYMHTCMYMYLIHVHIHRNPLPPDDRPAEIVLHSKKQMYNMAKYTQFRRANPTIKIGAYVHPRTYVFACMCEVGRGKKVKGRERERTRENESMK